MDEETDQICPRCRNLKLDEIFSGTASVTSGLDSPVAIITDLSRNCRRTRCKLCRFLSQSTLLDSVKIGDTWALFSLDFDRLIANVEIPGIRKKVTSVRQVLSLLPYDEDEPSTGELNTSGSDLILRVADDNSTIDRPNGRVLHKARVDYELLKSWIYDCRRNHTACFSTTSSPVKGMRVIDCATGDVVPYRSGAYAALSYCVGPKPRQRRWPKVVTDALLCCKGLELPYLWVDSICIDQTDKVALQAAISNMHLVYSAAIVTIVSLGPTQAHGLSGISTVSRREQPMLKTVQNTYVSSMHNLPLAIANSQWTNRAWCFQEAVLSQRILFFGAHQAYFLCNESVLSESTKADPHCSTLALRGLRATNAPRGLTRSASGNLWELAAWLDQYSTKELSFQTDVLNAFRGVLSVSKHPSLWGVPFVFSTRMTSPAGAFAIGLSWSTSYNKHASTHHMSMNHGTGSAWFMRRWKLPTKDVYSRPDFPSWAWPSCRVFRWPIMYKGPGDFRIDFEEELNQHEIDPKLDIFVEGANGSSTPIADYLMQAGHDTHILPQTSRFLRITANTFPVKLCRVIVRPSIPIFHEDIESFTAVIDAVSQPNEAGGAPTVDVVQLREAHQQRDKIRLLSEDLMKEALARFCIRIQHSEYPSLSTESFTVEHDTRVEALSELEDGRFMVDFDRPPTIEDGYCDVVQNKDLLGVLLFHRMDELTDTESITAEESDVANGEYCVLVVEKHESTDHYQRIGLVWVDVEHIQLLHLTEQTIRLG